MDEQKETEIVTAETTTETTEKKAPKKRRAAKKKAKKAVKKNAKRAKRFKDQLDADRGAICISLSREAYKAMEKKRAGARDEDGTRGISRSKAIGRALLAWKGK